MKRLAVALLIVGVFLVIRAPADAQAPPPRPEQPHQDVFSCGVPDCQLYNPTNQEAKNTHAIQYRLLVMPGCVAGLIVGDLDSLRIELDEAVQFSFERNDGAPDFTIRVNCGLGQSTVCGSVNIWCLGRGFPGIADVDASDIMYSPVLYPQITRLSILCHEICGHALATWNEQYCIGTETTGICRGLARFTSAPGWIDFMSTGPNSRHLFEEIEIARWQRTMYLLQQPEPCEPCWNGTRFVFLDGWQVDPSDWNWYAPWGERIWGTCNLAHRDCFYFPSGDWVFEGSVLFRNGQLLRPPLP